MIKTLVEKKNGISLYAYIDEPTNIVKYYVVRDGLTCNSLLTKFYSYSKAKDYYDALFRSETVRSIMPIIGEELKLCERLKSIDVEKLTDFLEYYKFSRDYLFNDSLVRKFPNLNLEDADMLLNILKNAGLAEEFLCWRCPVCRHVIYYGDYLNYLAKDKKIQCKFCGVESCISDNYIWTGYKIN